jgi:RHS repeat-associated protein
LEGAIDNQSSGNYLYDVNGSLKKDVQGQIDTIKYDYRDLPLEIKKAGTSTYYRYNAEGQRVFKQTGTGVSTYYIMDVSGRTLAVVRSSTGYPVFNLWGNDHIGQLVVSYGAGGNGIVQGLETPLVTQTRSDTRYYFLKDHLGSVRVTVDVSGNVTSYDDFYPFGMTMDGRSGNFGSGDARYKYTTKERDAESGYDYFGARYYDARIGRWMAVDPLAERYAQWSPFGYANENPLRLIDTDGRGVKESLVAAWNSISGKVTFGIQGGIRVGVGRKAIDISGNFLSTSVVTKEKNSDLSWFPGDASTGGSLILSGFGASVEKVLSPTTTTTTYQGITTSITSSNTITTQVDVSLGVFTRSVQTVETATQALGSDAVKSETSSSDNSISPLNAVDLGFSAFIGVDLQISIHGLVDAFKQLNK